MKNEYLIRLRDGRRKTYDCRQELGANEFVFYNKSKKNKYWEKETTNKKDIEFWKRFARSHGLICEVEDALYSRNSTYRKDFFEQNKPFWKNRYFCVYCGRLLPKNKIEIDHIIPVHQAKKWYVRKMLRKMHGVNDPKNLGASCRKCNRAKGSKMNGWVFRGHLGKSNAYQVFRWIVRFVVVILIIFTVLYIWKSGVLLPA